jgi:predicted acylesterase/phospholipase RssA
VLCERFEPDLVVGASVGSLNGYLIASGIGAEELCGRWRDPKSTSFDNLDANIQDMMSQYHLRIPFAVTLTDLWRMKPRTFRDAEVTWRHLSASCAVPFFLPQKKIDGKWYTDGGLLNPLPLWAAVELGATRVIALHVLPEVPSGVLRPLVRAFRGIFGYRPPVPAGVEVDMLLPSERLGSIRDTFEWNAANAERWIELGASDAKKHFH